MWHVEHEIALIQAMGMLFTASTLALAVALQRNELLTIELGILSAAACPSLVAESASTSLGAKSQNTFRQAPMCNERSAMRDLAPAFQPITSERMDSEPASIFSAKKRTGSFLSLSPRI